MNKCNEKLITIFLSICIVIGAYVLIGNGEASARSFTSPGEMKSGEYRYIENPDETFTEYYKPKTGEEAIRGSTYSKEAMEESNRLYSEVGVDEGTTGQNGSIVIGSDGNNIYASERVVQAIRTDQPYSNVGEAEVGDELIGEGVGEGTLPSLPSAASALSGTLLEAGGAAVTGLYIGEKIDDLLGWPKLGIFESSGKREERRSFEGLSKVFWLNLWSTHAGAKLGIVTSCEVSESHGFIHVDPGEEFCEYPLSFVKDESSYTFDGEEHICTGSGFIGDEGIAERAGAQMYSRSNGGEFRGCGIGAGTGEGGVSMLPEGCSAGWWTCDIHERLCDSEDICTLNEYAYAPLFSTTNYRAFPGEGLEKFEENSVETKPAPEIVPKRIEHTITPGKIEPVEREKHKELVEVPVPSRTYIDEKGKEEKGKPVVEPEEELTTLPSPASPVVPEIKPNEPYEEYAREVEREGLKPEKITLPEIDIDPHTGPGDVASTFPSAGSRVAPDTDVEVNTNPPESPAPEESGKIGGPTLPGIHFPSVHLLCTTMPFGVPCWMVKQIEAFSGTSEAPIWHIGPFSFGSHTIPEAVVHLSVIEPVMVVVRPFMVLFGTIGLLLFFYSVFTGSKIGGGENPSGQVPEPDSYGGFFEEHATDEPQVESTRHSDEYYKGFR